MTTTQIILTILAAAAAPVLTRALPFFAFPADRPAPRYIRYLGNALPGAIFGLLVVYCLKGADVLGPTHAIPEAVALAAIYVLHRAKHNALLSIAGGTAVYVVLLRIMSAAL